MSAREGPLLPLLVAPPFGLVNSKLWPNKLKQSAPTVHPTTVATTFGDATRTFIQHLLPSHLVPNDRLDVLVVLALSMLIARLLALTEVTRARPSLPRRKHCPCCSLSPSFPPCNLPRIAREGAVARGGRGQQHASFFPPTVRNEKASPPPPAALLTCTKP